MSKKVDELVEQLKQQIWLEMKIENIKDFCEHNNYSYEISKEKTESYPNGYIHFYKNDDAENCCIRVEGEKMGDGFSVWIWKTKEKSYTDNTYLNETSLIYDFFIDIWREKRVKFEDIIDSF